MDCRKAKEFILGEYFDGELDSATLSEIEKHMSFCSSCRELASMIKQYTVVPLENLTCPEVPSGIWESIKPQISRRGSWAGIDNALRMIFDRTGLYYLLNLLIDGACFTVLVLTMINLSASSSDVQLADSYTAAPHYYIMRSVGSDSYGTQIEKYFL